MKKRLSPAQADLLQCLGSADRTDITDECVAKALARRGLAERYSEQLGHMRSRHSWRITEAGRAALKEEEGRTP